MFDIRAALNEVCNILKFNIDAKGLKLETFISASVPDIILCDSKRYKQIIFNILGNAIKFTFKGKISIKLDFKDSNLITIVSDTGIGISKDI